MATIELQTDLPVGSGPPAEHVSAATKVLRASEYGGRKAIKVRALRTMQLDILDIVVT